MEGIVELIIKNLSRNEDFRMSIGLDSTVLSLKERLAKEYPDGPGVECQRLIFAGRELKDPNSTLGSIFKTLKFSVPFFFSFENLPFQFIQFNAKFTNRLFTLLLLGRFITTSNTTYCNTSKINTTTNSSTTYTIYIYGDVTLF